jgi:hypothetical protein
MNLGIPLAMGYSKLTPGPGWFMGWFMAVGIPDQSTFNMSMGIKKDPEMEVR